MTRIGICFATTTLCALALSAQAVAALQITNDAQEAAVATALVRARKVGTVESTTVSSTTLGSAQTSIDPTAPLVPGMSADSEVELVTVHGKFADYMAKLPRWAETPAGTMMSFIVDRQTGFVEGIYLGGSTLSPADAARTKSKAAAASLRRKPRAKAASWGSEGCSQAEGHHCYALATWYMTGGEKVEGTLAIQDTTAMNVPGWASGDFVDDEEWTSFQPSGYWVEAGNTAGEYFDCCGLHPFFAHKNQPGSLGYGQYVAPWTIKPGYGGPEGEPYYQMVGPGPIWTTYWWGHNVTHEGGFSTYSNQLEVGVEIAANTKPSNAASIADNATWTNGTVHNWNKVEWYAQPGLCIGPNGKAPATGNVAVGTC